MVRLMLGVTALLVGLSLFGQGAYLHSKAVLAQWLINYSWQQRSPGLPPSTPWGWADTRAIAMLNVPALDKSVYVMDAASGEALAFGPGHMVGSALPGKPGHSIIAGHRDSHFEFLQRVRNGQLLEAIHFDGSSTRYRVSAIDIIDSRYQQIPLHPAEHRLTLVTCYPFNKLASRGPLRLLVSAEADSPTPMLPGSYKSKPQESTQPAIVQKSLETFSPLALTD